MENSEKFFWGGSIASHQCDGAYDQDGKGPGIMDYVTAGSVSKPREFHDKCRDGVIYPSHYGIDFYHRYKEDIALFKEAGFGQEYILTEMITSLIEQELSITEML